MPLPEYYTDKQRAEHAEREQILSALETWIKQRPGLEFGNYGDVSSYRAELRSITRDLHHARILLAYVWRRESITAENLKAAFKGAFSGRLSWREAGPLKLEGMRAGTSGRNIGRLEYCTGQYWPTEYRAAACAVLASAIWDWLRDSIPPADYDKAHHAQHPRPLTYNGKSAGDYLRSAARRELGATIQKRWFN